MGEGVAGRARVILEGRWFITVAKRKDAVTRLRFQSRLHHFLTSVLRGVPGTRQPLINGQ